MHKHTIGYPIWHLIKDCENPIDTITIEICVEYLRETITPIVFRLLAIVPIDTNIPLVD